LLRTIISRPHFGGNRAELPLEAKKLARKKPEGGRLLLGAISAELAARGGLNQRANPFAAKSIASMLVSCGHIAH
jgi:hypothetical protein